MPCRTTKAGTQEDHGYGTCHADKGDQNCRDDRQRSHDFLDFHTDSSQFGINSIQGTFPVRIQVVNDLLKSAR
jgi:hypothetical protein